MVNNGEYLVGGLETMIFLTFHTVGNVIIQLTIRHIFQRGWLKPPARKCLAFWFGVPKFLGNLHLFAERGPMDLGVISMNMPIHQAL